MLHRFTYFFLDRKSWGKNWIDSKMADATNWLYDDIDAYSYRQSIKVCLIHGRAACRSTTTSHTIFVYFYIYRSASNDLIRMVIKINLAPDWITQPQPSRQICWIFKRMQIQTSMRWDCFQLATATATASNNHYLSHQILVVVVVVA